MTEQKIGVEVNFDRGLRINAPFLSGGVFIDNTRSENASKAFCYLDQKQKDALADAINLHERTGLPKIGFEGATIYVALKHLGKLPKI
ncbi:MAG: hypothetical protein Q7K54_03245 [Candidatus Parcubacteria bacterium]|nr:hypothetical protein [Candidatus Parcubacteria bacterium]